MKKSPDPVRKQIDGLLAEIGAKQTAISFMQKRMEGEIERLTAGYKPEIKTAQEGLKAIEAELIGLMKYHKAKLFDATDHVDLKNGTILRQIERRVKRVKGMLQRLKALGEIAAIKVVESVDWDQIEKWDDIRLSAAGTKRTAKEIFSYSLRKTK